MAEHTALPWTKWNERTIIGGDGYAILTVDQAVCFAADWEDSAGEIERTEEEAEANAHFIVQAVNAHEGLVSALRAAAWEIHKGHGVPVEVCRNELCTQLRVAMATARS